MLNESPSIETDSTLDAGSSFTSATEAVHGASDRVMYIIGSVFADESGTLKIQFDDGSGEWDAERTRDYTASQNLGFKVPVVSPYFRVVYENGSTNQGTFRLKAWEMV